MRCLLTQAKRPAELDRDRELYAGGKAKATLAAGNFPSAGGVYNVSREGSLWRPQFWT
jgi:hypothetical protein